MGQILNNPLYAGRIRHAGEEYAGVHDPILSGEDARLWDASLSVRSSKVRRKGGRHPKGSHLLVKGLLKCGKCGYSMVPRTDPNRWGYEAHQCRGRLERGPDFCDMPMMRRRVPSGGVPSGGAGGSGARVVWPLASTASDDRTRGKPGSPPRASSWPPGAASSPSDDRMPAWRVRDR